MRSRKADCKDMHTDYIKKDKKKRAVKVQILVKRLSYVYSNM